MFLGITAQVAAIGARENNEYSLIFDDNPLNDFVELPEGECAGLWYSNVLAGVIRGALEMVQMKVESRYVSCMLRGDQTNEIRVVLREVLADEIPVGEEEK